MYALLGRKCWDISSNGRNLRMMLKMKCASQENKDILYHLHESLRLPMQEWKEKYW